MPQQTDTATPVALSSIDTHLVGRKASAWAGERLSKIFAVGVIERTDETTEIPSLPPNALTQLALNRTLVLRAILIMPAPDLDLAMWKETLDAEADHEGDED